MPLLVIVVVVCHDQVRCQIIQNSCRRGSRTHESIPLDSATNSQVSSPSDGRCKRTSVSCIVSKIHSLYRCRLVRRTPFAYSTAVDGCVLIVVVADCIVVSGSVSVPRPLMGGGRSLSTLLFPLR